MQFFSCSVFDIVSKKGGGVLVELVKYSATSICDKNLIGYIVDQRKKLKNGCYDTNEKEYIMIVNIYTMPDTVYYGQWLINPKTIKKIN